MRTPDEGVHGGEKQVPPDVPPTPPPPGDVRRSESLAALAGEYAFFSHGLLFTHGLMTREPLAGLVASSGGRVRPFALTFPRRLFLGFGCDWDARLLAVRREHWPSVDRFLSSISGVDHGRRRFYQVVSQQMELADPVAPADGHEVKVAVVLYALSGNDHLVGFAPPGPGCRWPRVVKLPPEPRVLRLAAAVLGEDPYPFRATDDEVLRPRGG